MIYLYYGLFVFFFTEVYAPCLSVFVSCVCLSLSPQLAVAGEETFSTFLEIFMLILCR
jgi:hypothetical protein